MIKIKVPFTIYCVVFGLASMLVSCTPSYGQPDPVSSSSKQFKEYWYAGEAELTRYELEQARYGEIHKGDAVLIFVTEDFDTKRQVKHEYGQRNHVASVLKLNFTRKFFTGLYPYSIMTSTFTPVNGDQKTLKLSFTSQEWCGHTFGQLNHKKGLYTGTYNSYFQREGDSEFEVDDVLLEDEIWTKIRLNPSSLSTGQIKVIPGTTFLRLSHREYQVANATASKESINDPSLSDKPLVKYSLIYEDIDRSLSIFYEVQFPYAIVAWEESSQSGFGNDAKMLTTRAIRTHTINSAYWRQNDVADGSLKSALGLDLENY